MKQLSRFTELDVWRGLAIVGMVFFHIIFLLDYLQILSIPYGGGGWHLLARLVQWSFLLLVGIGLRLAYEKSVLLGQKKTDFLLRNVKRAAEIFLCGMMMTFFTFLLVPHEYVRFGILHLVGVSLLLLGFVVDRPRLCFFLGIVIYLLSFVTASITAKSSWLIVLGYKYPLFTLDYFPLLPWMGIPAIGIFLGSILYPKYQRAYQMPFSFKDSHLLAILGRHSLLIYLLHFPILIVLILILKQWIYG